jgi:hypothetical protein
LYETIDIIKGGGFMNDLRWATFPAAGGKTVFKTAANLSPIGPGPSTVIWSAGPGPIQDDIEIVDTASRQATYQKFLTDTFLSTDQLLVDRVFPQDTIGTSDQVTVNVDAPALQPLTIVTSVPVVFFFSGDVGVTTATGVSQWSDQSGNSRHLVQATGASQPTYNATALNGKGSLTFDGVDDVLGMSYVPPAPGTTPSWYWLIFRVIVHTSTMTVYGSTNTNRHRLFMTTASRLQVSNGVGGGLITEVAGTWYRNELSLTNSTNDYHKNGSTLTTGTNFGNNAGNIAMFLGAANSSFVLPGNIEVVCWGCWAGEPTSAEKTALNAWVTSYYGAAVQT